MRQLTMTALHWDSFNGDDVLRLEPGETYDVPDDVAGRYLAAGIARDAALAVEVKDAGAADENKTVDEPVSRPARSRKPK